MGAPRRWRKSPGLRWARRRLSSLQLLLYPLLWAGTHAWIGILHRGVRWSESGPFRSFVTRRRPAILCMWHQDVLTTTLFLAAQGHRYPKTFMISDGRAAILGSFMLRGYGFAFVMGGKHRDGGRVGVVERLAEECRATGCAPIITGDGSRGPANEARWGAVHLARDTGLPIVPLRTWFSHAWTLPNWARMQLPWPWPIGRAHVASGEPLVVPPDADKTTLERCRAELERRLNALAPVAEAETRKSGPIRRGLRDGLPRIADPANA